MKQKHYYAKKDGTCYMFADSQARSWAVAAGACALTAAEAMKEFGYTDSCSCRVIKATDVTVNEDNRTSTKDDIFSGNVVKSFIKYILAEWQWHKQKYAVIYKYSDTSTYLYLFWWDGKMIRTYTPGTVAEAQNLIDLYHFLRQHTRVYVRDTGEDVTAKVFNASEG